MLKNDGSFTKDSQGNITAIQGRTLKVSNLSDELRGSYFQAWVDGYQNDGFSHNEAVQNALYFAKNDKRSV